MRQWCGIASGNGVLLFGAAPLPGPTLTYQDIPREIEQNTLLTPQLRTPNGAGNASQQLTSVWLVYNIYIHIYIYIYIYMYIYIYIFVVVNFDALAQASDIQIERRQVVFLCWMQDLNPGPQTPNRQQTECSLTNRLSYRGSSKKLELDSPSLWSAYIYIYNIDMNILFKVNTRNTHFRLLKSCSWNMIKKNYSPPLRTYKLT